LRQILLNLLGNAVKFTNRGRVTLRVSAVNVSGSQQTIRFEIIDTGIGIATEQIEKIFQPFEQVGDRKLKAEGTGLGLVISRQLVELMRGKLDVCSELGKGSTFSFEIALPVVEGMEQDRQEGMCRVIGYQGQPRKLLVVDDKRENRLVLLNMLEPLGFEIVMAENGQQEVDLAREIYPDLILTDLVMPVKTGFEAVQEIRQIPEIKDIPIIAISASVLDLDREQILAVGCQAFLPKPIDEQQLLALLAQYLHLDWIYEDPALVAKMPQAISEPAIVPPPTEEMEILYELAKLGSMKKIRDRAAYLADLDEKYVPFANRLEELAHGFQEKAIVTFIEKYLYTNES
jgi:CheY-like chemotaxis protein